MKTLKQIFIVKQEQTFVVVAVYRRFGETIYQNEHCKSDVTTNTCLDNDPKFVQVAMLRTDSDNFARHAAIELAQEHGLQLQECLL